jgi:hypothetical protein
MMVTISSPSAIAIYGAVTLAHHLTLALAGQQIEQCGGGNGSAINDGLLMLHGQLDIGQYWYTPYSQIVIKDTQMLAANSAGFVRIIGNTNPTLNIGPVANLFGVTSRLGPIDLRNQKGDVSVSTIVRSTAGSVQVCGIKSCP